MLGAAVTLEASTFSAIAAFGSCLAAWTNYQHSKQKDKRDQASKIAAWINNININKSPIEACITISNASELPIYDVFIIGLMSHQELENINIYKKYRHFNSVLPNSKNRKNEYIMPGLSADIGGKHMEIAIFFRDANGVEWLRDNKGILREFDDYKEFLGEKGISAPYI